MSLQKSNLLKKIDLLDYIFKSNTLRKMNCLRPTQVITNWLNNACSSEDDVRLKIYYKELYEQKLPSPKKNLTNVNWVQAPQKPVPYHPTLLPKTPNGPSQQPLVDKAMLKDTQHSAKAPRVDMPDAFLLGP